jgi:DNA polymerase III subunit delta
VVAIRNQDADAFIARPDPRRPIVLVFGPDLGLVRERTDALLRASSGDNSDPFSTVTIDGDVLASDPGRLADEARTIGLFGGRRLVHVRAGSRNFGDALEGLLADPPKDAFVVIEAGDLRKGAPLRKLAESSPHAAAVACYADTERDVARLVDQTLREAGLTIDADARDALVSLLGGDRLASRSELDKLVLFAKDKRRIDYDDILSIIADSSSLALDDVVDAAAAGDQEAALAALGKARATGIPASSVIGAAIRHVATLHKLSLRIERGERAGSVVDDPQLRIHFRRKPLFERALARFGPAALEQSLTALGHASLAARRSASLAEPIAEREILALARGAKRRR